MPEEWRSRLFSRPQLRPEGIGLGFLFEPMDEPRGRRRRRDPRRGLGAAAGSRSPVSQRRSLRGGQDGRDEFAPAWWTLGDAAGNEADIATTSTSGRD